MPNGRPHDNPISDILIHGMHPYPHDLEELVKQLHGLNPAIFNELDCEPFEWEKGKRINEAKELLESLIECHGDPRQIHKTIAAYKAKYLGQS